MQRANLGNQASKHEVKKQQKTGRSVKRRSGQIRNNYELPVLMTALYAFNRTGWICDPEDIEDRT